MPMVVALDFPRRLTHVLHNGKQQPDDADHDQDFDQRHTAAVFATDSLITAVCYLNLDLYWIRRRAALVAALSVRQEGAHLKTTNACAIPAESAG